MLRSTLLLTAALSIFVISSTIAAQGTRNAKPINDGFGAGAYPYRSVTVADGWCNDEPGYTDAAREAKIEGRVVVEVVVRANGTVGEARVTRSLDPGLDARALEAARKCRFKPGERGRGNAVASLYPLTFVFRLQPVGRIPGESEQSETDALFAQDAYSLKTPGIQSPRILKEEAPKYTRAAMRARIQGPVTLDVVVAADGSVRAARVRTSLDANLGLDQQAVAAVRNWRFQPATLDGKQVPAVMTVQVSFKLH